MSNYHLTPISRNAKVGPMPTTVSTASTCPDVCPLKNAGCYADGGPAGMHWRHVTNGSRGDTWAVFLDKLSRSIWGGQLWRHNVSGDLPGEGDAINGDMLSQLVDVNRSRGAKGFTYTHKPVLDNEANANAIANANANGFTINLSANTLAEADKLASLYIGPVVCIVAKDCEQVTQTPEGRKVTVCPAQTRENVSCFSCGLCARADRDVIVGFQAHGFRTAKANAIATA